MYILCRRAVALYVASNEIYMYVVLLVLLVSIQKRSTVMNLYCCTKFFFFPLLIEIERSINLLEKINIYRQLYMVVLYLPEGIHCKTTCLLEFLLVFLAETITRST